MFRQTSYYGLNLSSGGFIFQDVRIHCWIIHKMGTYHRWSVTTSHPLFILTGDLGLKLHTSRDEQRRLRWNMPGGWIWHHGLNSAKIIFKTIKGWPCENSICFDLIRLRRHMTITPPSTQQPWNQRACVEGRGRGAEVRPERDEVLMKGGEVNAWRDSSNSPPLGSLCQQGAEDQLTSHNRL